MITEGRIIGTAELGLSDQTTVRAGVVFCPGLLAQLLSIALELEALIVYLHYHSRSCKYLLAIAESIFTCTLLRRQKYHC